MPIMQALGKQRQKDQKSRTSSTTREFEVSLSYVRLCLYRKKKLMRKKCPFINPNYSGQILNLLRKTSDPNVHLPWFPGETKQPP